MGNKSKASAKTAKTAVQSRKRKASKAKIEQPKQAKRYALPARVFPPESPSQSPSPSTPGRPSEFLKGRGGLLDQAIEDEEVEVINAESDKSEDEEEEGEEQETDYEALYKLPDYMKDLPNGLEYDDDGFDPDYSESDREDEDKKELLKEEVKAWHEIRRIIWYFQHEKKLQARRDRLEEAKELLRKLKIAEKELGNASDSSDD